MMVVFLSLVLCHIMHTSFKTEYMGNLVGDRRVPLLQIALQRKLKYEIIQSGISFFFLLLLYAWCNADFFTHRMGSRWRAWKRQTETATRQVGSGTVTLILFRLCHPSL